jgi:EmrB/QacA subfamily drug resistance transporter
VRDEAASDLVLDAPGLEETTSLPWPLLLRQRVSERLEASERYPWLVLAAVLLGLFAVGSTITVLALSVPEMMADLDTDSSTISWVTTGPVLAFAVFGPVAGKLADLRGLRRVYLLSLAAAVVFAALTAAAPNVGAVIACRVLGAAAGAAVGPASLAIINRLFPPGQRAQALGYWSMVAAGGPVIGAIGAGPIVEAFGWRWIFILQAPLMAACCVMAAVVLPAIEPLVGRDGERPRLDGWGATTLGLGCVSLLLAVNRGAAWEWTHPVVLVGFVLAVVFVAGFLAVERRVAHPLLPLGYLRRRNFAVPVAAQFFTNFAYMGAFFLTPLLLQGELGRSVTESTWLSIARPTVFAVAGPIAGALTVRFGERPPSVVGAASIVASMVVFGSVGAGAGNTLVLVALALSGLGMGASSPALAATIANAVEDRDLGIAGAAQQMVNQVGVAIGVQAMLAVQTARAGSVGDVGAYGDAYLFGGAVAAVGLVLSWFVRSSPRSQATEAPAEEAVGADLVGAS